MSAVSQPRQGIERPARDLHCPECGRFIAAVLVPESIKLGESWVRVYCRHCGKFRRFDPGTVKVRDERR